MWKKYLGNYIINRKWQRDLRGEAYKMLTPVDLSFLKHHTKIYTIDKNGIQKFNPQEDKKVKTKMLVEMKTIKGAI